MKIKMLTGFAGVDFAVSPGDETDRFSADEGARMIAAGFAEAVPSKRAVKAPLERAVQAPAPENRQE